MIIVFFLNLVALASAFMLTYKLFVFRRRVDSFLAFFIFYFAQIILTQTLLGALGALYLKNVIWLNSALCAAVWLVARNRKSSFIVFGLRDELRALLNNKVILFAAAFLAGFAIIKIAINLVNPPFGWDNISYHFVYPVEWLKSGNLNTPISICDDPSPPYYPINGSLFFLWFMLPLKNVFLADLGQVPFFLVALFSIFSICRKLHLSKELSFYAGALFLITPNVFKQLEIAYVDVMFAALFLGALNFLLAIYKDFSFNDLVAWSLFFGAFLGTKTSAILYGGLLVVFFAFVLLILLFKKNDSAKAITFCFIFVLLTALLGGYAYIRNYIITGNPLFPADIALFGKKLFKGVMPFVTYRAHWTPEDFNFKKFLFEEGLGGQLIIFVLPALAVSVPLAFQEARKKFSMHTAFMYLLPILLYAVFIKFMPQFWVRYLYPFLGAGYIVAMLVAQRFNINRILVRALVSACIIGSVAELSGHWELFCSMMLSICLLFALPRFLKARLSPMRIVLTAALSIVLLTLLNHDYDAHEFDRYAFGNDRYLRYVKGDRLVWKWLNDTTAGTAIAYAGQPLILPLYGTHFKNNVEYVSVNSIHPPRLHDFPNAYYTWDEDYLKVIKGLEREGNFRQNPSYGAWLKNLRSDKIEYLVAYTFRRLPRPVFPLENEWAQSHPEDFDLAYSNDAVRVYRLKK